MNGSADGRRDRSCHSSVSTTRWPSAWASASPRRRISLWACRDIAIKSTPRTVSLATESSHPRERSSSPHSLVVHGRAGRGEIPGPGACACEAGGPTGRPASRWWAVVPAAVGRPNGGGPGLGAPPRLRPELCGSARLGLMELRLQLLDLRLGIFLALLDAGLNAAPCAPRASPSAGPLAPLRSPARGQRPAGA